MGRWFGSSRLTDYAEVDQTLADLPIPIQLLLFGAE
jgi:hypothetical protein